MIINISDNITGIHYYNKCLVAFSKSGKEYLFKNPLEVEIISSVINSITLDDLAIMVYNKYNLIDTDVSEVKETILGFLTSEVNKELFILNGSRNTDLNITGDAEKYYPYRIQIDVTNICNLECNHCYKTANSSKKNIGFYQIKELLSFFNKGLQSIGLTGGEPLLHPQFENIVNLCRNKAKKLELNTNGLLLYKVSPDTINQFDNISISLYGLNNDEYKANVGINYGYDMLQKSCTYLKENNCKFNVSILLNKLNYSSMRAYVNLAVELGAFSVQFGKVSKLGRANDPFKDWLYLNLEEEKIAYRTMRELIKEYYTKIKIVEWGRNIYTTNNHETSFYHIYNDSPFICTAGTLQWSVNENFKFKPCVMMPNEENLMIDFNEWKNYILGKKAICWNEYLANLKKHCLCNNQVVSDYCERLVIDS